MHFSSINIDHELKKSISVQEKAGVMNANVV